LLQFVLFDDFELPPMVLFPKIHVDVTSFPIVAGDVINEGAKSEHADPPNPLVICHIALSKQDAWHLRPSGLPLFLDASKGGWFEVPDVDVCKI
jgi:hypothetical protein